MKGFLMGAYTPNPETGATKAVFGWYADFLKYMVDNNWTSWFGPLVAWGEHLSKSYDGRNIVSGVAFIHGGRTVATASRRPRM